MWMIVAKDKANHFGAFDRWACGEITRLTHTSENAPMDGFQAIASIWQRAISDDRETICGKSLRHDNRKIFADNPIFV
jgi:hypothetical protein